MKLLYLLYRPQGTKTTTGNRMEHVIPLSKKKVLLLLLGSAVFVGLGGLLMIAEETPRHPELLLKIVGVLGVALFGIAFLYALWKLFDTSPGLIINSQGIQDNSSAVAVGYIPWYDIADITIAKMGSQRFITVHVRNPHRYFKNGNFFKKMLLRATYKSFGSPVQISPNSLKIDFDNLFSIIQKYHLKYT